jgi:cytochrome c-type biogenesis protein CcmH/NrfG
MRPQTLNEIQANVFGFGKRLRAFSDNAERWRKLSTAYAKAGQFREADDAESNAIDIERGISQLHEWAILNG